MGHVVITGATGAPGAQICRGLAQRGHQILGIGRRVEKCRALSMQGIETLCHDLTHPLSTKDLPETISAVVHCIPPHPRPGAGQDSATSLLRNLVSLAQEKSVRRFILLSSAEVYRRAADSLDQRESDPLPPPLSAQTQTAIDAEKMLLGRPALHPVILRTSTLYGEGAGGFLPYLQTLSEKRKLPLLRGGQAGEDYLHISDLCAAMDVCLVPNSAIDMQVFNLSGGAEMLLRTLLDHLAEGQQTPIGWRTANLPAAMARAATVDALARLGVTTDLTRADLLRMAYRQTLDISKARQLLDWQPEVTAGDSLSAPGRKGQAA